MNLEVAPVDVKELADRIRGVEFEGMKYLWENVHWTPLVVILDGHNSTTGERIHVVKGGLKPQIIRNALVIGKPEYDKTMEFLANE